MIYFGEAIIHQLLWHLGILKLQVLVLVRNTLRGMIGVLVKKLLNFRVHFENQID